MDAPATATQHGLVSIGTLMMHKKFDMLLRPHFARTDANVQRHSSLKVVMRGNGVLGRTYLIPTQSSSQPRGCGFTRNDYTTSALRENACFTFCPNQTLPSHVLASQKPQHFGSRSR
jgi:hypothetical protein